MLIIHGVLALRRMSARPSLRPAIGMIAVVANALAVSVVASTSPTGRPLHWFYQTTLDGSDARVTRNPSVDCVAVIRVDARTDRISYKKGRCGDDGRNQRDF